MVSEYKPKPSLLHFPRRHNEIPENILKDYPGVDLDLGSSSTSNKANNGSLLAMMKEQYPDGLKIRVKAAPCRPRSKALYSDSGCPDISSNLKEFVFG